MVLLGLLSKDRGRFKKTGPTLDDINPALP